MRSDRFKYIVNLTPEETFRNICVRSKTFQSWIEKAQTGDSDAVEKVRRYQHRPAVELYDITKDEYEWKNLAGDPQYATVEADLKKQLESWMKSQGDKGAQTELEAKEHQNRNRNKKKRPGKTGKKKKKAGEKK